MSDDARREVEGLSDRVVTARGVWAASAVFAVLASVYIGTNWMDSPTIARFLISEVAFLAPIVGATVFGLLVRRSSSGRESRFWLLLSLANAILVVSEAYYIWWVLFVDIAGPPPVYAPFQALHAIAASLFFAALLAMTKFQNATPATRLRWSLDAVAVLAVVYAAIFELVLRPLFAGIPSVLPIERIAGAVYPTVGVATLSATVLTLVGFKVSRWRAWERLVAMSLCIYALGFSAWPLWLAAYRTQGASLERGIIDIALLAGHYLLMMAAFIRVRRPSHHWPLRPMPLFQPTRRRSGLIVPGFTLAALPVMTLLGLRSDPTSLDFIVYLGTATVLAFAMVVRSTVAAVENGRLFQRAATDAITGLFNVRLLHERLEVEMGLAERYSEPLSLIVLDVDDFERINRRFGHPAGDDLLREFGATVKMGSRESDMVCRTGGDEFAVVLPGADALEALKIALRIQQELRLRPARDYQAVTASIGIASYPQHAASGTELVRLAQGARYWVKRHGKDHALVYDPSVVVELDADERVRALEEQSQTGAVRALAAAVDARDPDTKDHSRDVAVFAVNIARELGLDDGRVQMIETAAIMHDVGKIGIPDEILSKEGRLGEEEFAAVMEHPALAERILSSIAQREVLPWVRHHHERWDGHGYPDGLRAIEIPLEARILAVCDAYDAMISHRPYRSALTSDEAVEQLIAGAGAQFDPSVVEVFLRTLGRSSHAPAGPGRGSGPGRKTRGRR
jgi:diguanylate cyclase (GGDEF)-like protein